MEIHCKHTFRNQTIKLILFLSLLPSTFLKAFEGRVLEHQTKIPIEGVHLLINKKTLLATTNAHGFFELKNLEQYPDTLIIEFSNLSYNYQFVSIKKLKDSKGLVYLKPKTRPLSEVRISSEIKQNSSLPYEIFAELPEANFGSASVIADSVLYLFGGDISNLNLDLKRAFDENPELSLTDVLKKNYGGLNWNEYSNSLISINLYTKKTKLVETKLSKRAYHNMHVVNEQLYIIGGIYNSVNQRKKYLNEYIVFFHPETNTFRRDGVNPHQSINFASCIFKNQLFIFGGSNEMNSQEEKQCIRDVHVFDFISGHWYALPPMKQAKETNGIRINDKLYLVGGWNNKALASVETFDLNTGKWEFLGELPEKVERPALAYYNNKIYIFENGMMLVFNTIEKKAYKYLIDLPLKYANMHFFNMQLLIINGQLQENYQSSPSNLIYSIKLENFNKTKINNSIFLKQ